MGPKTIFVCILCLLAWLACATFIGAAAYLHYAMNVRDVVPLIMGGVASGGGGCYLVYELLYGEWK